MRVFFPPHPHQNLFLVLLTITILTGVRWNLSVVLILISFIAKDVEHLFIYFYLPFVLLLRTFNSFAHLLVGLFIIWYLIYLSLMHILDINSYLMNSWQRFFSHSVDHLLILLIVSFDVQKLFNLMKFQLSILAHISWAIGVQFRK
jgi:hypothetical protein